MLIRRALASAGAAPTALTIGTFDGVHRGHQALLTRLRDGARQRDLPAAVLTFDPHPREFFSSDQAPARLTSLREKLALLARARVDCVYVARFDTALARMAPEEFVQRIVVGGLSARWLLIGDDFRFGARRAGDFALLETMGAEAGVVVEAMPTVRLDGDRVSSSTIRAALAAGRLDAAERLLGRPYSICGRVVGGDRIGTRLGFPTANVRMNHNRPPLTGIFAVEVGEIGDRPLPGVASIGVRPTVNDAGRFSLEVHLWDFAGDLYGRMLEVTFLHKLRNEEKYPDLQALSRQIGRDVQEARHWFERRRVPLAGADRRTAPAETSKGS